MKAQGRERGQATVELALCLPFVVLLVAVVVEIGMLGADQVRLWHAAREAAREASVEGDPEAIRAAAQRSGLEPLEVSIDPVRANRTQGRPVRVELVHQPSGHIPLTGELLSRLSLRAEATMRIEQP